MLYHFLFPLADEYIIFNLFKYLTFRTGGAILTALIISFIIGPSMIQWLRGQQVNGQPIRDDGPETHLAKRGTPTMGGLMILVALMVCSAEISSKTNEGACENRWERFLTTLEKLVVESEKTAMTYPYGWVW